MSVSIIGSGIAGLASAIALKQQGIELSVFERTHEQQHLGAGIVLWPNAMFVLEQLDLLEQILKVSAPVKRMQRYNSQNLALNSLDIEALNTAAKFTSRSILRADLMAVLLEKAHSLAIPIHYCHEFLKLKESASGLELTFNNNPPGRDQSANTSLLTHTCQALIGADGRMQSTLRKHLLGDNTAVYQNFINVIGICSQVSPPDSTNSSANNQDVLDYWGVGERFGIVPVNSQSSIVNPLNTASHQANGYWAAGWYQAEKSDTQTCEGQALLDSLKAQFRHWPAAVKHTLDSTDPSTLKKLYIHDHDPQPNWSKGNLLMIGDAAHAALPTSGQGACQALEDAWWLAKITAQQGINPTAFSHFSAQRHNKTQAITQSGRAMAKSIFNPCIEACKARDLSLSQAPQNADATAIAKFWMQGLESAVGVW